MDFTAEHYFRAALERISQAHSLYRDPQRNSYALAMYTAGLAVECLLRAYMLKRGKQEFESRHDVLLLLKESGMLNVDPERLKANGLTQGQIEGHERALRTSVNEVFILWRNNYRYASEARLLAHLRSMRLYRRRDRHVLKANALRLLNAAQGFINKGVLQWQ